MSKATVLAVAAYVVVDQFLPRLLRGVGVDFSRFSTAASWGMCAAIVAASPLSGLVRFIAVGQMILAVATVRACFSFPLLAQVVQMPAAASAVALVSGGFDFGTPIGGSAAVLVLAMQFHHVVLSVIRALTFPAPWVAGLARIDEARTQLLLSDTHHARVSFRSTVDTGAVLDGLLWTNPSVLGGSRRTIVYLGGNGEVAEHSMQGDFVLLARAVGANALTFNPRGVGASTGRVFTANDIVDDAADAVRFALSRTPGATARDIVVFGHSIGGGVAAELVVTRREFAECGLLLDRTFSSLVDAAISLMGLPPWLARRGVSYSFGAMDTAALLPKLTHDRWIVTFHRQDQIIHHGRSSLERATPSAAHIVELTGVAGDPHNQPINNFRGYDEVVRRLVLFYSREANTNTR